MFDGVTLPFTSAEVVGGAMDFMKLLGPYIMIGLALALAPRIINIVKGIFAPRGRA